MTCKKARERHCKDVSEERVITVSFTEDLAADELLTGTPTITELVTSDLTISNIGFNTVDLDNEGDTILIGQAVQFLVSGGNPGLADHIDYEIEVKSSTDSSPAQFLRGLIELKVSKE